MAVHKQTAASKSASPAIKLQHGIVGGLPITAPTNPPTKFAHTPNFRASLGHLLCPLPAPPPFPEPPPLSELPPLPEPPVLPPLPVLGGLL
ncbi:14 kda proline-rich protein dc2.15 [Nicotiana attenuata]|uniref:14 kDa proline-rich protein dc2.15 n=1 Tax=Nicotiana attenuata TaxID=49451 RepID=A0A1J6J907_NICAT|nr:14 kda proline-rich protein dc2.15 [Nicotiana attenuata]